MTDGQRMKDDRKTLLAATEALACGRLRIYQGSGGIFWGPILRDIEAALEVLERRLHEAEAEPEKGGGA